MGTKKIKIKHIVFLCHIISIQVDKQGLDISKLTRQIMYLPPIVPTSSYEVKHEEKWFWVSSMEISKNQKLHFRATKKDRCLSFHFHVLNLFKSWSNLGFDQDSNGHKNSDKKLKNEKPKHIAFLIMSYSKHSS